MHRIQLIPLAETTDGKELLHAHGVRILRKQIKRKFAPPDDKLESLANNLGQLNLVDQDDLLEAILEMTTLDELTDWLEERTN